MTSKNITQANVGVVLPAAGFGTRFGEKKQFKELNGRPIYYHALLPFLSINAVREIVLVMPEESVQQSHRELKSMITTKPIRVIPGGKRRQDSVYLGLQALSDACEWVCVHDAVRPFVTENQILTTIETAKVADGAILAIPSKDTVKLVEKEIIQNTVSRDKVWLAQTPQVFRRELLQKAFQLTKNNEQVVTDESSMMEQCGYKIKTVKGSWLNIKVTTPEDWIIAETIINQPLSDGDNSLQLGKESQ